MLLAVMAAGGMFALSAGAGARESVSGQISFYGDIGNVVNRAYGRNPLLVRPSTPAAAVLPNLDSPSDAEPTAGRHELGRGAMAAVISSVSEI